MKKRKFSKDSINKPELKKNNLLRNKGFWGLLIIVVMVGSIFAFSAFYSSEQNTENILEYNGYKLINIQSLK